MLRACTALARIFAAGVLMAFAGSAAAQQAYPSKPLRFITPFPPGGSTSIVARLIGQKLAEKWGQQVIVDNRPGGNTIIGTEAVAKAPPDGYTILLVSTNFVTGPSLLPHLPYDTIKDFDAVATIGKSRNVLVLNPSVPANTLQEFIALARSKPGQLNYASASSGGIQHLSGELFSLMAGIKTQHIPYRGSGPALADLVGGQVQFGFNNPLATIPLLKSGKLKAIAITGETRSPALPQVPTYAEAGLPGYEITGWLGVVAPAGTPKGIIDKMSSEMAVILTMPDIQEYLAKQGMEPFISTPGRVTALIKADITKFAKIIKAAHIKIEN